MGKMKNKAIEKANKKLTKDQVTELEGKKFSVDDAKMFLHCRHCMDDFQAGKFGKGKAPKEAMTYCVGSVPVEFEDKILHIVAAFCNRCGRLVWDSRHLTHRY